MDYIVVSEYTAEAGGRSGLRFAKKYPSRKSFLKEPVNPLTKIIAKGIDEKKSALLLAQTAEISIITAAIEDSCYSDGTIDRFALNHSLALAVTTIKHNRQLNHMLDEGQPPDNCVDMIIADEGNQTEKFLLLQTAVDLCSDSPKPLDIDFIVIKLDKKFQEIFNARLMTYL